MKLLLKQLHLQLAEFALELDVQVEGQVVGLFGVSGSGKTSMLDLIAGLRRPASGRIQLDETLLTDAASDRCVPPHQRSIGYVPQDGALFPHLSVLQNILYGRRGRPEPGFSPDHVMEVLGIGTLLKRNIRDLSGGEKQRVALARALLSHPRLLLLDEPLASLDGGLKEKSLGLLRGIRSEFAVPMIYVSHSADEIFALSDVAIVLEKGRVVRHGATATIFEEVRADVVRLRG